MNKFILVILILIPFNLANACTWQVQVTNLKTNEVKYFQPTLKATTIDLSFTAAEATCGARIVEDPLSKEDKKLVKSYEKVMLSCKYFGSTPFHMVATYAEFKTGQKRLVPIILYLNDRQKEEEMLVQVRVECKEGLAF